MRKQQEIYKIEGVDDTEINTRDRKKRKHQGDGEGVSDVSLNCSIGPSLTCILPG